MTAGQTFFVATNVHSVTSPCLAGSDIRDGALFCIVPVLQTQLTIPTDGGIACVLFSRKMGHHGLLPQILGLLFHSSGAGARRHPRHGEVSLAVCMNGLVNPTIRAMAMSLLLFP